jgi:hypothetical protein
VAGLIDRVIPLGMVKRVLLVSSLLFASCHKDPAATTGPRPPNNTVAVKGPDYSATLADPVGFLPVDSELVLGLDIDSLRKSPLWPQLVGKLATAMGPSLRMFQDKCGFDPMATLHSITMGLKNLKQDVPEGVMVISGLDRAKLTACIATIKTKPGTTESIVFDGDVILASNSTGSKSAFTFVDASTIVGAIGPAAGKPQLASVLASGAPLHTSPAFAELLKLTDLEASLWTVLNGSSSIFDAAASGIGMRPKAVFGSVTLAAGLTMNLRMRLETSAQAQQLQQMASGQIGMARAMFDKLDITTDNADVVVAVAMNEQQLNNIMQMLLGAVGGP